MSELVVKEDAVQPPPSENSLADLLRTVLRARMRDLGLNQSELGRRVGLSSGSVNQLIHGGHDGYVSTWSRILDALDQDALETYATGSLSPTQLTRPLGPKLVSGDYYADLSYAMHDVGVRNGVRVFQIDLPLAQLEDLLTGRAVFQIDRILDRTAIAFAPVPEVQEVPDVQEVPEQLGFPMDGQEVAHEAPPA